MDTSTPSNPTADTYIDIENSIIDNMAEIGVYGFAVYSMLQCYLQQTPTSAPPSYATIARKLGMDRGAVIRHVKKLQRLKLLSPTLHFLEEGRAKRRNRRYSRQEMSYTPHKSTHTFLRALEQGEEATRGFFLMQSAASRCRMSKYFFRLPDRGLIRKYKRPRETTVAGSLSRALTTIRMQCDAVAP